LVVIMSRRTSLPVAASASSERPLHSPPPAGRTQWFATKHWIRLPISDQTKQSPGELGRAASASIPSIPDTPADNAAPDNPLPGSPKATDLMGLFPRSVTPQVLGISVFQILWKE